MQALSDGAREAQLSRIMPVTPEASHEWGQIPANNFRLATNNNDLKLPR
jgi:hypothetical protein